VRDQNPEVRPLPCLFLLKVKKCLRFAVCFYIVAAMFL
jgi:hypothetical protein